MAESRRKEFFPEVTDEQWNDWKWQVKNRIETVDQLKKYLDLDPSEEEGIRKALQMLRMAITPYYLSLIDKNDPHCPIRKQAVPSALELHKASADLEDPLHEDSDSSRTGINSPLSGPSVVPDHGPMFHVLPSLYPQTFCRTKRQCLPDRTY